MNAAQTLHFDLLVLTWLALFLAVPAYALVRKTSPLARWNEHGNVYTGIFGKADLLLVVLFFLAAPNLPLLAEMWGQGETAPGDPREVGIADLVANGLFFLVLTGALCLGLALRREVSLAELWGLQRLRWRQAAGWSLLLAALVVPLILLVADRSRALLQHWIGDIPAQPLVEAFAQDERAAFRVMLGLTAVVLAPVFEEVFYRGYLYAVVKRFSDRFFAAVFSSLVFALNHEGVISYAPLFVLALFLAVSYELSGSLWIPMGVHALFNLANLTAMLVTGGAQGGGGG
ncbi:MAG TPA: CPBP family intramembrane glutamic endopeptidase [Verrucomicrobiales bacterium]|nr:CPBP family intramembrane glutamic endopeptidase [Verrucomicrobiales bacterium]